MFNLNSKNNKGFTLLEALVAISILMVAVVAPITIAQKGLSSSFYIKNQMIASYLAQDAIEYIKNKRDQVTINDVGTATHIPGWNGLGIFSLCNASVNPRGCQIDTIKDVDFVNNDGGEAVKTYDSSNYLYIDNDNSFYGYTTGSNYTPTGFTRNIRIVFSEINTINGPVNDQALIVVTIKWGEGEQIIVKSLIFNY
jgi:type II secretory pathway pseudopilin PulG